MNPLKQQDFEILQSESRHAQIGKSERRKQLQNIISNTHPELFLKLRQLKLRTWAKLPLEPLPSRELLKIVYDGLQLHSPEGPGTNLHTIKLVRADIQLSTIISLPSDDRIPNLARLILGMSPQYEQGDIGRLLTTLQHECPKFEASDWSYSMIDLSSLPLSDLTQLVSLKTLHVDLGLLVSRQDYCHVHNALPPNFTAPHLFHGHEENPWSLASQQRCQPCWIYPTRPRSRICRLTWGGSGAGKITKRRDGSASIS